MPDTAKIFANIAKFKRVAAGLPLDELDELPSYARVHVLAAAHERLGALDRPLRRWQYTPSYSIGRVRNQYEIVAELNIERWAREAWFWSTPMPVQSLEDTFGKVDIVAEWRAIKAEMTRAGTLPQGGDIIRKKPKPAAV